MRGPSLAMPWQGWGKLMHVCSNDCWAGTFRIVFLFGRPSYQIPWKFFTPGDITSFGYLKFFAVLLYKAHLSEVAFLSLENS